MEGNKDEAKRCVELGENYIAEGKYDKAEKFLGKAQKLFPTEKAEGTWSINTWVNHPFVYIDNVQY